jgi:hypothetical protein
MDEIQREPAPAGLTPETVEMLKATLVARGLPPTLYKFSFEHDTFAFRPLYRPDWVQLEAFMQSNPNARQDIFDQKICEKALLYPEELINPVMWDLQRAGYQQTLARYITAKSGFLDPEIENSTRVEPLTTVETDAPPVGELVEELKRTYFPWTLTLVTVMGEHFVVRPLNRTEWKGLTGAGADPNMPELKQKVAERATVWCSRGGNAPINFNEKLAGIINTLSQVILEASGFTAEPTVEAL